PLFPQDSVNFIDDGHFQDVQAVIFIRAVVVVFSGDPSPPSSSGRIGPPAAVHAVQRLMARSSPNSPAARPIQKPIKQISITPNRDGLKPISLSTLAAASIHPRDQRAPRPPVDPRATGQQPPEPHSASMATLH
ncbi:hypothetical protein ACLOJK_034464, partial [Asimina triloba]